MKNHHRHHQVPAHPLVQIPTRLPPPPPPQTQKQVTMKKNNNMNTMSGRDAVEMAPLSRFLFFLNLLISSSLGWHLLARPRRCVEDKKDGPP